MSAWPSIVIYLPTLNLSLFLSFGTKYPTYPFNLEFPFTVYEKLVLYIAEKLEFSREEIWEAFYKLRPSQQELLKKVLGEVLRDLKQQKKCYVKYEVKQGCQTFPKVQKPVLQTLCIPGNQKVLPIPPDLSLKFLQKHINIQ